MAVRVGINGFGRMGRLAQRAAIGNPAFTVVHVNEAKGGPDTAAHLLEIDSVHGRWPVPVAADSSGFTVRRPSHQFHQRRRLPEEIPWDECGRRGGAWNAQENF